MRLGLSILTVVFSFALSGCATVQYGTKDTEANLQKLLPVSTKTSLYVCREAAALFGAGNRTTAVVDGRPIGTLKPANFAHVIVEPGSHDIYVKRNPGGDSGILRISSQPNEVVIIWVGMTGAGFGVLTVDNFSTKTEAEQCVRSAQYAVQADS
jgi:hypothetical protein